jgi:hypothetical protein
VRRCAVQTIENLAAGIVGRNRAYVATDGVARRVHARDDGKLRVCGEQHHHQHQHALGNDVAVMGSRQKHDDQKNQSTEQAHPVQTYERTADYQAGGMQALVAKEGRKLAERNGGENGAKKYQRAQPGAERKVNQRVKEGSHKEANHVLYGRPAGEPLYTAGHRRMSRKEIGKARSP